MFYRDMSLRELLLDAIRYGDRPEVRAQLTEVIDDALDIGHLRELIEERALTHGTIDTTRLQGHT